MQALRAQIGVSEDHETVELDGVRIAYEDTGSGPVVVCLHAAGHGGRDFELFRDRVADRFRVIAFDFPGQGRSGADKTPASGPRYARLLELLLEHLSIEDPIILGNSIGAETAMRFAAQRPESVRALVIADPGGLGPVNLSAQIVCRLMVAFFRAGGRRARWFSSAFSAYYKIVLPAAPAHPQRARIVAAGFEIAPILAQCWQSFSVPEADVRGSIEKIACPVLFTWAKDDKVVSYKRSKKSVDRFPNAKLLFFTGGHAPFLEDPDAFAQAFVDFANSLPTTEGRVSGSAQEPTDCDPHR